MSAISCWSLQETLFTVDKKQFADMGNILEVSCPTSSLRIDDIFVLLELVLTIQLNLVFKFLDRVFASKKLVVYDVDNDINSRWARFA